VPTLPPGVKTADDVLRTLAEERDGAARIRGDLFGAYRPPGLLLQGELDSSQQRPVLPPGDLREVPFWIASDLQKGVLGGTYAVEVPRLYRLGDLQIKGKVSPVDEQGWQEIDVTIKTGELALREDSKRFVSMFVRPFVLYGFDGRLRIR